MRRAVSTALPWAVAVAGVLAVVAGAVVLWRAGPPSAVAYGGSDTPLGPADTAYSSSLEVTFDRAALLVTTGDLTGAGLTVLGALVLAGLGGWLLGRHPAGGVPHRPRG